MEMRHTEKDAENAGPGRRTTGIERVERRTPARASSAPQEREYESDTHHFVWFVWGVGGVLRAERGCVCPDPFHVRDFFSEGAFRV